MRGLWKAGVLCVCLVSRHSSLASTVVAIRSNFTSSLYTLFFSTLLSADIQTTPRSELHGASTVCLGRCVYKELASCGYGDVMVSFLVAYRYTGNRLEGSLFRELCCCCPHQHCRPLSVWLYNIGRPSWHDGVAKASPFSVQFNLLSNSGFRFVVPNQHCATCS